MRYGLKEYVGFILSYIIVLGSYLYMHITDDWFSGMGPINAFFFSVIYGIVSIIVFFSLRKKMKAIALGFLWGFISILVFLFTIGGCGLIR